MNKLKNLLFFILIGFSSNLCNAQLNNYTRETFYLPYSATNKTKSNTNIPFGTIHLKDNLFIDAVPVYNLGYLEFLTFVSYFWNEKESEEINKLPDFGLNMAIMKQIFDSIPLNSDFVKSMNLNDNLKIDGKENGDCGCA